MSSHSSNSGILDEVPLVFDVEGELLIGVLHRNSMNLRTGIVFVVGGRQYRTGAQRQYVRLARYLAIHGYSSFRFDIRGMGDSTASQRHFMETGKDIKAAMDQFQKQAPWVDRIVLWGLCDGASASINFTARESVHSVVMVNPWVTTNAGAARTILKHHYWPLFVSASFWKRLLKGEVGFVRSLCSLFADFYKGFAEVFGISVARQSEDLPYAIFSAMESYEGEVAVITSDRDLTAKEFLDQYDKHYKNGKKVSSHTHFFTVNADHSFSDPEQHKKLEMLTLSWCNRVNSL